MRHTRFAPFTLVTLLALAACGGDTGGVTGDPLESFDDQQIGVALDDLSSTALITEDAQAILLDATLALAGMGAEFDPATISRPTLDVAERYADSQLKTLLDRATSFSTLTEFPAGIQGNTFVYNPSNMDWEVDDSRTGAPANGVRIIYYEADVSGAPASPLVELGFIDLTDEDTQTADRLGVRIVRNQGNVTIADFTQSYSESETSTTFNYSYSVGGFFSDGTDQVDFSIAQSGTETETGEEADLDVTFAGPDATFTWTADETHTYSTESTTGEMTLSVDRGAITTALTLETTAEDDALEGPLTHGGVVVANVSLSNTESGSPVTAYTKPGGGTFTAAEEARIEAVVMGLFVTGITLVFSTLGFLI